MVRVVIDANGYARTGHSTYQHRVITEQALGRALRGTECVHHINGNKADNRPENLVLCPSQSYHLMLHARQRILATGGNPNTQKICSGCKRLLFKTEFSFAKRWWDGRSSSCRNCTNARRRGRGYNYWGPRAAELQRLRRAKRAK